ncbi:SDR family NAD(P)-dependent oxidoreductase [Corynebacterium uberis]|uniref:SDR family NAD(P)-dependent oxidoreductase n=1 Tax=Corynebacterium TaxID=1716 RepID=UPI001D09FDB5|nr:SDR family NAD(P)-dependent oxidoreductase [Corynebacterium uberis]MCZ9308668.1 SDR family NAD(P)-dependent oxidoreductase [Corynebacterium sp. c6VSa_13]UDL74307.1 SDR family NAD(P)-dependent oxidoreductase [Corynebacterium uberis]UDL76860.1 SDR family NAD(P)-dependent oxidoreductase [Corynebacterium uberis]UDL79073.1 SDR family NAD(P)-dependent oxidoreductase [Corynebacterium uberis]UDL79311.1 SDR family NAD(P)-dependent oxidoreductase [Corynebacterium uberis]
MAHATGVGPGPLLVLGATSEIGSELAYRLAAGRPVMLAARRPEALEPVAERLRAAGATQVAVTSFEAADPGATRAVLEQMRSGMGIPAIAVVAFGILGDQERAQRDEHHAWEIATVDYAAQVAALTTVVEQLGTPSVQSPRVVVAFSSIAGWRARRANYVYGSTKAGLDAFCQGLSDRCYGTGVRIITARPGFVRGRMTAGMDPAPLSVAAGDVADAVDAVVTRGSDSATVWIPRRLRILAWVMRLVPRFLWRRMPR